LNLEQALNLLFTLEEAEDDSFLPLRMQVEDFIHDTFPEESILRSDLNPGLKKALRDNGFHALSQIRRTPDPDLLMVVNKKIDLAYIREIAPYLD
jgi:hypothetical protein